MKFAILFTLILINSAFAGGDNASTKTCDNGIHKARIKREGSFFGKNQITVWESKLFGQTLVNEKYEQDWSPTGIYGVEQVAKKESPCSTSDFYLLLVSENTITVQAYAQNCRNGEKTTLYIQMRDSNKIIKFNEDTQCVTK